MKPISILNNLLLPSLLLLSLASNCQAQPTQSPASKVGAAPKKAKKGALKHAQDVLGKPLTPAQIKAVRIAGANQKKALKPIREKYRVEVAKALGLTLTQYQVGSGFWHRGNLHDFGRQVVFGRED